MPIEIPTLDDRTFDQLRADALARVPVHTPEWTHLDRSDPGVTVVELFAFLVESLLYRARQIPERNRRKFLSLLGQPLQPAAAARGLARIANERGPFETLTVDAGIELRAGAVPFRTERTVDVVPVDARAYLKRLLPKVSDDVRDKYRRMYAALLRSKKDASELELYETAPFASGEIAAAQPLDLRDDVVDRSLWLALIIRPDEVKRWGARARDEVRKQLAGRTLSIGVVPVPAEGGGRDLLPGGTSGTQAPPKLALQLPVPEKLPAEGERVPGYVTLTEVPLPAEPSTMEVTLPSRGEELGLWELEPLEAGTGEFPPSLEDHDLEGRVLTWLRIVAPPGVSVRLLWIGLNAVTLTQRARVVNEVLPQGTGEPDQAAVLSRSPVLPGTVEVFVGAGTAAEPWREIKELGLAGPEVPVPDPRRAPGSPAPPARPTKVFAVDAEAGRVQFGDGLRGARPPDKAPVRADYDYCAGRGGNVPAGAVNASAALPAGVKVANPIPSWGGVDAETVASGEKQVARTLQHRDRAVTAADFETITLRTPGVSVGRVEVLPAYHPDVSELPGSAPGAVTVMVVPSGDPYPQDGPDPFLDAVACWLESSRLVTTQVFIRRPTFMETWVSVAVDGIPGISPAQLRRDVDRAVTSFLSPLPEGGVQELADQVELFTAPQYAAERRGWPLRTPVVDLELATAVARVPGVARVRRVLVGGPGGDANGNLEMKRLELPRLAAPVSVSIGADPTPIAAMQGSPLPGAPAATSSRVPAPVVPEECR